MSGSSQDTQDTHAGWSFFRRLRRLRGHPIPPAGEQQESALAPVQENPLAPVVERLEAIEQRLEGLEAIEQRLEGLAPLKTPAEVAADGVQQALAALEKQVSRAGREQFKAQALAEAQMDQLSAALEMLRAADARREAELAAWRDRTRAEQTAARLDVVQAMLPALDGLDEALRSGQRLLEQHSEPLHPPTLMGRLRTGLALRRRETAQSAEAALREAMAAWLVGLTFVRQRLLDVLAAEGVQPIAAQGVPFDPHYHVAVEVVPSDATVPPGTVASELRRGYMAGDRVLRYAEVAVATETERDTSRAS